MVEILYLDSQIVVCVKPRGIVSQDAGQKSLPFLLKQQLNASYIGVVHRLDREVGGVMVYALEENAAAILSKSIQDRSFSKTYLTVLCGIPEKETDLLEDLLYHDKGKNKTYVVNRRRNGVKDASLDYRVLGTSEKRTLALVHLHTGRTHQIRVQFASRRLPLAGDRKYGGEPGEFGLWSYRLVFRHPATGAHLEFVKLPPDGLPWVDFSDIYPELSD